MVSSRALRRWPSRPLVASSWMVIPDLSARRRTASTKSRCSISRMKVMASPLALASEAVVEPLLGVDTERRGLLPVERAETDPAPTLSLQGRVLADEGDDVGCRPHPGNVFIGDPHGAMTVPRGCPRHSPAAATSARYRTGYPLAEAWPCAWRWAWLRAWPVRLGLVLGGLGVPCRAWPASTAWAAASRAMGTRKGEQLT